MPKLRYSKFRFGDFRAGLGQLNEAGSDNFFNSTNFKLNSRGDDIVSSEALSHEGSFSEDGPVNPHVRYMDESNGWLMIVGVNPSTSKVEVHRSSDGSEPWVKIKTFDDSDGNFVGGFSFKQNFILQYYNTVSGTIKFAYSGDAGSSWSEVEDVDFYITSFTIHADDFYILTSDNKIYKSSDGFNYELYYDSSADQFIPLSLVSFGDFLMFLGENASETNALFRFDSSSNPLLLRYLYGKFSPFCLYNLADELFIFSSSSENLNIYSFDFDTLTLITSIPRLIQTGFQLYDINPPVVLGSDEEKVFFTVFGFSDEISEIFVLHSTGSVFRYKEIVADDFDLGAKFSVYAFKKFNTQFYFAVHDITEQRYEIVRTSTNLSSVAELITSIHQFPDKIVRKQIIIGVSPLPALTRLRVYYAFDSDVFDDNWFLLATLSAGDFRSSATFNNGFVDNFFRIKFVLDTTDGSPIPSIVDHIYAELLYKEFGMSVAD